MTLDLILIGIAITLDPLPLTALLPVITTVTATMRISRSSGGWDALSWVCHGGDR